MSIDPAKMSIQLLGPLSVRLNGQPIMPSAAKQRRLLALLALNFGRIIPVPTLMEEIWEGYPPRSAAATLQTYVLQLRRHIAAAADSQRAAKQVLCTRHCGYALEAADADIDVVTFRRLADSGRGYAEIGDHRQASEWFSRALAMWQGPVLADVSLGPVLELSAIELEEARLGVLKRRIEADLALQRHADILGELRSLAAQHPLNENFCAYLITALYRSGEVMGALAEYQRLRGRLRSELGVDPCPRLRRLQQAVLTGDVSLDAPAISLVA
jgi:SARP family transcriptional regulator, regulator of embCAB operon